ncbi:MAG: hypothetical protein AAF657_03610 [Acidobacteriota bacterium]
MKRCLFAAMLAALPLCSAASADEAPGVYVILDGSGSMWGQLPGGSHKITAAKDVIQGFVADDYAGRELAFRVYGHRRKGDCADSELVVPFSTPDAAIEQMRAFAEGVNPKGKTPISRSLRAALEDFGKRPGEIILVSDGIETCDEDPCALVREWRARSVDVRVHVVGLGLEDKERAAMECISEAAGTEYHDAQSADELAAGLKEIRDTAGDPSEMAPPEWQVLDIAATNEAGEPMRVMGTARWDGGGPVEVSSNGHNRVPPGEIEVTVGVRTWNGNLYEPVTHPVTVGASGATILEVLVPEPPSVRARFVERGEAHGGAFVRGYQGNQEVLGFRPKDRAYIDPGTYEFRSQPNNDNDLTVSETFAAGDHKEIVFELVHTVRALIKMVATDSGIDFRSNYELWQDGEKKYGVHWSNGVQALPGTYDLHLPLRLTPHVHEGLVLTTEDRQEHRIEVPVGHVTATYQKADGSPMRDERIFLQRKNDKGQWVRDRVSGTNKRIPLVPGKYKIEGWDRMGDFDTVFFEMTVGEEKTFTLQDKGSDG